MKSRNVLQISSYLTAQAFNGVREYTDSSFYFIHPRNVETRLSKMVGIFLIEELQKRKSIHFVENEQNVVKVSRYFWSIFVSIQVLQKRKSMNSI